MILLKWKEDPRASDGRDAWYRNSTHFCMSPRIKPNQDAQRMSIDSQGPSAYNSGADTVRGNGGTVRSIQLQGTPFVGDLRIGSWNAQALLARHRAKRTAK